MSITGVYKFPLRLLWIVPKRQWIYAYEIIARNIPEAHKHIHDIFISNDALVIYEFHSVLDESRIFIFIAADFSSKKLTPDDVLSAIKANKELVIEARVAGESKGFYYADMLFPIYLSKARAIIFDNASLKGLLSQFRANFGEDGASALLFHLGQAIGESLYNNYISGKISEDFGLRESLDSLKPILHSMGWGVIDKIDYTSDVIKIFVKNYWECELLKGSGFRGPTGQIFRGVLTTVIWKIHGSRVSVNEKKCVSLDDEICMFEAVPLSEKFR